LKWKPENFWKQTSITNIIYAVTGYCQDRGISLMPKTRLTPDRAFLEEMLQKNK